MRLGMKVRTIGVDRCCFSGDRGGERDGCIGTSAGLLRLVDREQPVYEGAIRSVHAGPRLRPRQHQSEQQHSDG